MAVALSQHTHLASPLLRWNLVLRQLLLALALYFSTFSLQNISLSVEGRCSILTQYSLLLGAVSRQTKKAKLVRRIEVDYLKIVRGNINKIFHSMPLRIDSLALCNLMFLYPACMSNRRFGFVFFRYLVFLALVTAVTVPSHEYLALRKR